jgi:hypothetical protein
VALGTIGRHRRTWFQSAGATCHSSSSRGQASPELGIGDAGAVAGEAMSEQAMQEKLGF